MIVYSPVPNDPAADQLVAFAEKDEKCTDWKDDNELTLALQSHVANVLPPCIFYFSFIYYLFIFIDPFYTCVLTCM